jgi:hypothetical protein
MRSQERQRESPSQDWSWCHKGVPCCDDIGRGAIVAIILDVKLRVRKVLNIALCVVVATVAIDIHSVPFDLHTDELGWSKKGVQNGGIPKITRPNILYGATGRNAQL